MAIDPKFLTGPIPGMSLTTEPGNRPWENPPEMVTIQEVAKFYTDRILDIDSEDAILKALDEGISIENIAEATLRSGVMDGRHTIDMLILAHPIVRELLMFVADSNGAEYVESYKKQAKEKRVPYSVAKRLMQEVVAEESAPAPVAEEVAPVQPRRGLMAPKEAA
jgi:hypothetical protein